MIIANDVDPHPSYVSWTSPGENGLYQLRWISGDSIYITDTFAVSTQPLPKVGLVCADTVLIYWDAVSNAEQYEIKLLGEKHLETKAVTKDTFYVLHAVNADPVYFSVVPIFDHHRGLASATINHQNQHVGCYLNSFYLREIKDGKGIFEIDLGVLIGVKAIRLEVRNSNGFMEVNRLSPVTQLANSIDGNSLHQGKNEYRVVIELLNGSTVISETVSVYSWRKRLYLFFRTLPIAMKKYISFREPRHLLIYKYWT
jgi:hypothetical protein